MEGGRREQHVCWLMEDGERTEGGARVLVDGGWWEDGGRTHVLVDEGWRVDGGWRTCVG